MSLIPLVWMLIGAVFSLTLTYLERSSRVKGSVTFGWDELAAVVFIWPLLLGMLINIYVIKRRNT